MMVHWPGSGNAPFVDYGTVDHGSISAFPTRGSNLALQPYGSTPAIREQKATVRHDPALLTASSIGARPLLLPLPARGISRG